MPGPSGEKGDSGHVGAMVSTAQYSQHIHHSSQSPLLWSSVSLKSVFNTTFPTAWNIVRDYYDFHLSWFCLALSCIVYRLVISWLIIYSIFLFSPQYQMQFYGSIIYSECSGCHAGHLQILPIYVYSICMWFGNSAFSVRALNHVIQVVYHTRNQNNSVVGVLSILSQGASMIDTLLHVIVTSKKQTKTNSFILEK